MTHRYEGIPTEVLRHPDLLAFVLPALRSDTLHAWRCDTLKVFSVRMFPVGRFFLQTAQTSMTGGGTSVTGNI